MSETCDVCTAPVGDARVCTRCLRDVCRCLGDMPWLSEQLDLVITRQDNIGPQSVGRSAETRVPFHVKAGAIRDELRNILVCWCRLYADETDDDLPADTIPAMSAYLLPRAEWLRHHDAAYDFATEIPDITKKATRIIDLATDRSVFTLAPCPQPNCPGEAKVHIPVDWDEPAWIGCNRTECGARWETWEWRRLGRELQRYAADHASSGDAPSQRRGARIPHTRTDDSAMAG